MLQPDGIIGNDFIRKGNFQIDFKNQTLTFHDYIIPMNTENYMYIVLCIHWQRLRLPLVITRSQMGLSAFFTHLNGSGILSEVSGTKL